MTERISLLKDQLLGRVPNSEGVGCILCDHLLRDLVKHGMFTDKHPEPTYDHKPTFPLEGKAMHLWVEGFWDDALKPLFASKKKG